MLLTTSDLIAVIGAVFAFLAVVVSFVAWRYPRRPVAVVYPSFEADVSNGTEPNFIAFIEQNDRKIVRLSVRIPMEAENIIAETTDKEGRAGTILTLHRNPKEGYVFGGLEVGLTSGNEAVGSPVVFTNGAHHIVGFYLVAFHPGVFQGFSCVTLTEVAADQVALRS